MKPFLQKAVRFIVCMPITRQDLVPECSLSKSPYKALWSTHSGAHQAEAEVDNAHCHLPSSVGYSLHYYLCSTKERHKMVMAAWH